MVEAMHGYMYRLHAGFQITVLSTADFDSCKQFVLETPLGYQMCNLDKPPNITLIKEGRHNRMHVR